MLIGMAGLPGTGKSTLGRAVAERLRVPILDKDEVRHAIFPGDWLDYSAEQDDLAEELVLRAAQFYLTTGRSRWVVLDGRTFSRTAQRRQVEQAAKAVRAGVVWVECTCPEEEIRRRLEYDLESGRHPARNRTFALYQGVKGRAEPWSEPRLVIDTSATPLAAAVESVLRYAGRFPAVC